MASLYGISIKLTADLKDFSSKLQNAERDLKRFGGNMQKVGKNLSVGLTAPIIGLGSIAVKTFADFEQSMAKVQAVSGATQSEFERLTKLARELGAATKFSASEVAGLELEFSKLGFNPQAIENLTASTLELATVADTDLANAATVAGATMRSFGIETENANTVVDIMASSFSSSALDMEKFSVAMAVVAPVAKSAGKSLAETTAQLSVLVNRGIDASTAGTALRNVFLKLAEKGMTWAEAVNEINNATDKNAAALELFGTRGATVAQILAENGDEIESLTEKYNNSAGTAKEMADIMNNTVLVSFEKLKSGIIEMGIAFGEILKPIVEILIAKISKLTDWFNNLSKGSKIAVVVLASMAAALGPLIYITGGVMKSIGSLIGVFRTLLVASTAATGGINVLKLAMNTIPLVAVIAGLTAIATSVYGAATAYEDATNKVKGFNAEIGDIDGLFQEMSQKMVILSNDVKYFNIDFAGFAHQLKSLDTSTIQNLQQHIMTKLKDVTREMVNATDEKTKSEIESKKERYNDYLKAINIELAKGSQEVDDLAKKTKKAGEAIKRYIPQSIAPKVGNVEGGESQTIDINTKPLLKATKVLNEYATAIRNAVVNNRIMGSELGSIDEQINITQASIANLTAQGYDEQNIAIQGLIAQLNELLLKKNEIQAANEAEMQQEQKRQTLIGMTRNAAVQLGNSLVNAAFSGANAMQSLKNALIQVSKQIITAFLAQAISSAIAKAMSSAGNPILGLILAGVAVAGVAAMFASKVPKLAKGGMAFAPTYAMIGDNPNAATDPEIVSPLSKLKQYLQPENSGFVGNVRFVIEGDQLTGVLNRYNSKIGRVK